MSASDRSHLEAHRLLIDWCLSLGVPFFWFGPGTLLISGRGAVEVIRSIESAGERVIGIEGFELESSDVHPRLDLIFDASLTDLDTNASFVAEEWGAGVWLEVVLSSKPMSTGPA